MQMSEIRRLALASYATNDDPNYIIRRRELLRKMIWGQVIFSAQIESGIHRRRALVPAHHAWKNLKILHVKTRTLV